MGQGIDQLQLLLLPLDIKKYGFSTSLGKHVSNQTLGTYWWDKKEETYSA